MDLLYVSESLTKINGSQVFPILKNVKQLEKTNTIRDTHPRKTFEVKSTWERGLREKMNLAIHLCTTSFLYFKLEVKPTYQDELQ